MDPIVTQLSNNATSQLGKKNLGDTLRVDVDGGGNSGQRFYDIMNQKSSEHLQQTLLENFNVGNQAGPQSLSANDVELTVVDPSTVEHRAVATDKEGVLNLLSDMNGKFNRMDRMVDLVSAGDTKLSYRDLIAMQMFMGKSVVAVETFTRVGEQLGKAAMGPFNMQV